MDNNQVPLSSDKPASPELPGFNDRFNADAEVRKGPAGQFAEKYNLPVDVKISFVPGGKTSVSIRVAIPPDKIHELADELRNILGEEGSRIMEVDDINQLSFEIDSAGKVIQKSLLITSAKSIDSSSDRSMHSTNKKSTGLCEKCQMNQGIEYAFHYGKFLSQTKNTTYNGTQKTTTTRKQYQIGGSSPTFVCKSCSRKYSITHLLPLILLNIAVIAGGVYLADLPANVDPAGSGVIFGALVVMVGLSFLIAQLVVYRGAYAAEKVAINLKKSDLKRQGFDTFWTTREFTEIKQ